MMKKCHKTDDIESLVIEVSPSEKINYCGVRATIEVLGGKWKFQIMSLLYKGPMRYSDIVKSIPLASEKMILYSLRELEEHKIIERIIHSGHPPKVEYAITEYGQAVKPLLRTIEKWGKTHMDTYPELFYFETSGAKLK